MNDFFDKIDEKKARTNEDFRQRNSTFDRGEPGMEQIIADLRKEGDCLHMQVRKRPNFGINHRLL